MSEQITLDEESIGRVLSVHGSRASVGLFLGVTPTTAKLDNELLVRVNRFLGIRSGQSVIVGAITDISVDVPILARETGYKAAANVDLLGEICAVGTSFQRGLTRYPAIGDVATVMSSDELRIVYHMQTPSTIDVGYLQQDSTIAARVDLTEMVDKHFAVLGTTGVGKSTGVAVILQKILSAQLDIRIFLLDGHNEYGHCFGNNALVINPGELRLPFWLFTFEEIVHIIFNGRPGNDAEIEILADLIPIAKGLYRQLTEPRSIRRTDPKSTGYTVDTPVPYRIQDLVGLIDEQMGKLEHRTSRMHYRRLIRRIEAVTSDPRYNFMFENANVGGDTMAEILRHLFRWRAEGKPITIMQLAGIPSEVVDAVVSVLSRMAFDFGLWSDGAKRLLFICEEAHRYISADRTLGFEPTRRALSRIAKEGRKYSISLGVITQRPAELDPTIISQCSTMFAMRMATDRDQELMRAAVSDTGTNLLAFLPSLGPREALAFGAGVALPTRFSFPLVPTELVPRSEAVSRQYLLTDVQTDDSLVDSVIEKWRGAASSKQNLEQAG